MNKLCVNSVKMLKNRDNLPNPYLKIDDNRHSIVQKI